MSASDRESNFHFTVIRPAFFSRTPFPIPSTFSSSWAFLNGPWASRYSMIFCAPPGPTPASFMSSVFCASLMLSFTSLPSTLTLVGLSGLSSAIAAPPVRHQIATATTPSQRVTMSAPPRIEMKSVTRLHAGARDRSMPRISDGAVYLAVRGRLELIEVGLPLPGEQRLLPGVAVLARGHHVGADRAAAAHERHDVIEGQRLGAHRASAVVAETGRDTPTPPRSLTQLARADLLATERVVVDLSHVAVLAHRSSPDTVDNRRDSSSHSFMSQATRSSVSLRAWAMSRARWPSR